MAVKALLGFLVGAFALGLVGGVALIAVNISRGRKPRPGIIIAIVCGIGAAIVVPLNAGLVLVQPDETGVVFRQTSRGNAALLEPLQPGLSWVLPFIDQVIIYHTGQQTVTMSGGQEAYEQGVESAGGAVRAISNDGQVIYLDVSVIFRIDTARVNDIHRNWRVTYVDNFIVVQARSAVRDVMNLYSAEEVYSGGRGALETQISDILSEAFNEQGFILTDLLIRDISFSPEFTDAIEQKQIADQQAQQAAFRVEQARQEAEQVRVEAQGLAEAAVIAAQGEAQSITIRAQAQSEALTMINEILSQNPNLIQWQYVNLLSDQVQLIIIPSNSPFLFDLTQLMAQAGGAPGAQPFVFPTPAP